MNAWGKRAIVYFGASIIDRNYTVYQPWIHFILIELNRWPFVPNLHSHKSAWTTLHHYICVLLYIDLLFCICILRWKALNLETSSVKSHMTRTIGSAARVTYHLLGVGTRTNIRTSGAGHTASRLGPMVPQAGCPTGFAYSLSYQDHLLAIPHKHTEFI